MQTVITNDEISIHIPGPPLFLRIRTICFGSMLFLSFLWIILLSLVIFIQWDFMDRTEHSLILIMVIVNVITVVMLPILLLRPFRPWLDAARAFFLIVCHFGVAAFFSYKSASFQCFAPSVDQGALCSITTTYIIIACWIIPALVLGYAGGLAVLMYYYQFTGVDTYNLKEKESETQTPSHFMC